MKIEIELDIETLVKEAIGEYIKENLIIHNTAQSIKIGETIPEVTVGVGDPPINASSETNSHVEWEYAPKPGRRRSKEEIALHELELKHGRLLTPEEKGEGKAVVEIEDTKKANAKEAAIKKDRIDQIAKEGMDAASEELAQETPTEPEAEIPKAEEIKTLDSMFT